MSEMIQKLLIKDVKEGVFVNDKPKFNLPFSLVAKKYDNIYLEKLTSRSENTKINFRFLDLHNKKNRFFLIKKISDHASPYEFLEIISNTRYNLEYIFMFNSVNQSEKEKNFRTDLGEMKETLEKAQNVDETVLEELDERRMTLKQIKLELKKGNLKILEETLVLKLSADSMPILDADSRFLKAYLESKTIEIEEMSYLHLQTYSHMYPTGASWDNIMPKRNIVHYTAQGRFITTIPQMHLNLNDELWGYDSLGTPFFFNNTRECFAPHIRVSGMTGSGKSVFMKYIGSQKIQSKFTLDGEIKINFGIIDPNSEYADFCYLFGGTYFPISPSSDASINLFDCLDMSRDEAVMHSETTFKILMGLEDQSQYQTINQCRKAYEFCLNDLQVPLDYHRTKYGLKSMPNLNHIFIKLHEMDATNKDGNISKSIKAAISRLEKYVDVDIKIKVKRAVKKKDSFITVEEEIHIKQKGVYSFVSKDTSNIDMSNISKAGYGLEGLPQLIKKGYMRFIFKNITSHLFKTANELKRKGIKPEPYLLITDETQNILRDEDAKVELEIAVTEGRKKGLEMMMGSQRASTFGDLNSSSDFNANIPTNIFLNQFESEASGIASALNLPKEFKDRLSLQQQGEYYASIKRKSGKPMGRFLKCLLPDDMLELFETNPEKLQAVIKKREREFVEIEKVILEKIKKPFEKKFGSIAIESYNKLKFEIDLTLDEETTLKRYEQEIERILEKKITPNQMLKYQYPIYVKKNMKRFIAIRQNANMKNKKMPSQDDVKTEFVNKHGLEKYNQLLNLQEKNNSEGLTSEEKVELNTLIGLEDDILSPSVSDTKIKNNELYYMFNEVSPEQYEKLKENNYVHVTLKVDWEQTVNFFTRVKHHKGGKYLDQETVDLYNSKHTVSQLDENDKHIIDHQALLVYSSFIANKFTDKIKLWETRDVDLEIDGKYAVEVESGSDKNETKHLLDKTKKNEKKYPKNWVYVVPRNDLKQPYIEAFEKALGIPKHQAKKRVLIRSEIFEWVSKKFTL